MKDDELIARATKRYFADCKRFGGTPTQPIPTLSTISRICPGTYWQDRLMITLRDGSERLRSGYIAEYYFYPASNRMIYIAGAHPEK